MTDRPPQAFIHGAAVNISWQDASKSLTDLIFATVSDALGDAAIDMAAVDSVVLSAHDLVDGRSLSSMVTAPAAGAYLRDEIRLSEDGLAALSLATARIEAGESELAVVAAWGRASEGDFLHTSRAGMDPFLQQPFGLDELDISAFRLTRWLADSGRDDAARERAAEARKRRAAANPRALRGPSRRDTPTYPLRDGEGPKWADVVVATIVGKRSDRVRVAGIGHGTDRTDFADRDLLGMPALRTASDEALRAAGTTLSGIGRIEVDGMTLSDEAIALEALGVCPRGAGFDTYADCPAVNASGGSEAGWCYPAMGLVRLAEGYFWLASGDADKAGNAPRRALALGHGARGYQTTTATVLEAE